MRRSSLVLLFVLGAAAVFGHAQAVESADVRQLTITAGGLASGFQPGEGGNYLVGIGTYADFHFTHWFQVEAEGHWLRWNEYYGEHQDNYLIGPRVPIMHFLSATDMARSPTWPLARRSIITWAAKSQSKRISNISTGPSG
jgi:hypothetical protein